ncbi:MAG: lipocalin family protein [Bacteroidales bacterium]|nr:lipocalin family protein [Bacteroidales bacterium]
MKRTIYLIFILCAAYTVNAQKELNKTETKWVLEAKSQLVSALTDPDMSDSERLRIVQRSAVTLKEYGQPSILPKGDIPLQKFMDAQFEQCKNEIVEMSAWSLNLEHKTFDQKMKLINTMQIEVIENQIQVLIPGSTPVQLTSDAISSVFGINIVSGVSGGKRQDARDLANRFKELAKSKELVKYINILVENHRESLRLIDEDRDLLRKKVMLWKRAYINAYNGAHTMKGYQGAILAQDKPVTQSNSIEGTWKFGYKETGYFYWTFKSNGEFVFEDKMNDGDTETGKYSVQGKTLKLIGPERECGKTEGIYHFVISGNDMEFSKIEDACSSRKYTLDHLWERR